MSKSIRNTIKSGGPGLLLVILTLYLLCPFLTNHSIPGWGEDPVFCVFTLKEVARKIAAGLSPFNDEFWNIRMFYPSLRVLAFSDPLILPGFLLFVLQQTGVPTFLGINIIFCLFLLLGWFSASLFFSAFGIEKKLALVGGWLWAFSSHVLSQSAHFQNTLAFGIPLSLSGLVLMFQGKRGGCAAFFGGLLILGSSNLYYLYFTLIASGILWVLLLMVEETKQQRIQLTWLYPVVLASGLLILSPILFRYFEVKKIYGAALSARPFWLQQHFAARATDYVTSNLVSPLYSSYIPQSENFERNAFPGLFSLAIALIGALMALFQCSQWIRGQRPLKSLKLPLVGGTLMIAGALLSSGPLLLPNGYEWLRDHLPGFADIRAVGRFGVLVVLGESCLIMYFLDSFLKSPRNGSKQAIVNIVLALIVIFQIGERIIPQYRNWQVPVEVDDESNAILTALDSQSSQGPLLEIGFEQSQTMHVDALRRALHHELPLLNGYSGFEPEGYSLETIVDDEQGCELLLQRYANLFKRAELLLIRGGGSNQIAKADDCLQQNGFLVTAHGDGANGKRWILFRNLALGQS